jgi:hypothetical protein
MPARDIVCGASMPPSGDTAPLRQLVQASNNPISHTHRSGVSVALAALADDFQGGRHAGARTSYTAGGVIHLLMVIAIVVIVFQFISGRRSV